MNRRLARLAALAVALTAAPAAALAAGTTPVAVLGFEAIDVPDALATEVGDAMKSRIAGSKSFTVVAGKDLMEVKLIFSCPDESPACMAQAGKSLGATKLVYGNVRKAGGELVVNIRLLDVNRGVIEGALSEPLPKRRDRASLDQAAQRWLAKLTGAPAPAATPTTGSIRVISSVPGATVLVDGARAGVAGPDGVLVSDIAPGRHEVRLEKTGFGTVRRELEVTAGEEGTARFTLLTTDVPVPPVDSRPGVEEPGVTTPPPSDDEHPDGMKRVLRNTFWISLGLGLASGVVTGKFAYDVHQVNKDLDPYRRFPAGTGNCPLTSPSPCGIDGTPAIALTDAERQYVADRRAAGDQAQKLQWTFLAVTGVFSVAALASGIAWVVYKGHSDEPHGSSSTSSVRLLPSASASSAGMMAIIDF